MKNCKSVIVTGGAGFIGKHLVNRIIKTNESYRVIVIDNLCNSSWNDFTDFFVKHKICSNTSSFQLDTTEMNGEARIGDRISFYKVDIRNAGEISEVLEKEIQKEVDISVCVHLAASISVAESMLRPHETKKVNVAGTENVVECARKIGISHFVFASSAAVYGIPTTLPISESETPTPISEYGKSKLNAEKIVAGYSKKKDRKGTSLRLFNVYGTGQTKEYAGVITKFADRIQRDLPPAIYGNGLQTRDFVHVDDAVDALMRAARLSEKKVSKVRKKQLMSLPKDTFQPAADLDSGVYNIGTGIATRINDLAHMIIDIVVPSYDFNRKLALKPIYLDPIDGDVNESYADIRRARHGLGFVPAVDLRDGLKYMLEENPCR